MKHLLLLPVLTLSLTVPAFDLQGHRGARGLAPENTVAAFEQALTIGVTTLELDIGLSSDGVPVVPHDPHMPPDMARDASGAWMGGPMHLIRKLSVAALQSFDLGRVREGSTTARNFPPSRMTRRHRRSLLAPCWQ